MLPNQQIALCHRPFGRLQARRFDQGVLTQPRPRTAVAFGRPYPGLGSEVLSGRLLTGRCMANFFAELKRRHIYRVGAAYVVVAWALTQLVEILAQVFTLPLWIAQAAIVLLAIGFPVALLITWTIESKPHEAVAAAVRSKPTIVDWTLCGALALVLIFIGYQQIAPSSEATRQAGVDAAKKRQHRKLRFLSPYFLSRICPAIRSRTSSPTG